MAPFYCACHMPHPLLTTTTSKHQDLSDAMLDVRAGIHATTHAFSFAFVRRSCGKQSTCCMGASTLIRFHMHLHARMHAASCSPDCTCLPSSHNCMHLPAAACRTALHAPACMRHVHAQVQSSTWHIILI